MCAKAEKNRLLKIFAIGNDDKMIEVCPCIIFS